MNSGVRPLTMAAQMERPAKQTVYWGTWMQFALLSVLLFLAGCSSIHLISDYDDVTDKSLTAIQQKTDDFIASLRKNYGTDAASLEKSKGFYEDIDQDLRRLEFRVGSIPKNTKTRTLVTNIRLAILGENTGAEGASLKDLHTLPENAGKGIPPKSLEVAQRNINQVISAALSLELAKKQGLEKNN